MSLLSLYLKDEPLAYLFYTHYINITRHCSISFSATQYFHHYNGLKLNAYRSLRHSFKNCPICKSLRFWTRFLVSVYLITRFFCLFEAITGCLAKKSSLCQPGFLKKRVQMEEILKIGHLPGISVRIWLIFYSYDRISMHFAAPLSFQIL